MNQDWLISEYQTQWNCSQKVMKTNQQSLQKTESSLKAKQKELCEYSFLKRLISFSLKSEINSLESERQALMENLKSITTTEKELYSQLYNSILTNLTLKNQATDYQHVSHLISNSNQLYCELLSLLNSGKECLSQIESAIDSVDSAESTEIMDICSSNSGIKMMSALNNATAHDDIDSANQAISDFAEQVKAFKQKEMCNIKEIQKDSLFISLNFNMALDILFDFYGFFTLSALSDAKSELGKAYDKIQSVAKVIEEYADKTYDYMDELDNKKQELLDMNKNEARDFLNTHNIWE